MPIRHISKPGEMIDDPDDLWRMSYCGTAVRVTKCISLNMYMKGFFEKVIYTRQRPVDKLVPCKECLTNLDGFDMLNQIP